MLVGTNNFNCTAEQIAEGIMELVRVIREKQPDAYIVLPVNRLFHLHLPDIPSWWLSSMLRMERPLEQLVISWELIYCIFTCNSTSCSTLEYVNVMC